MPPFAPRRARGSFIAATARAENPDWIDAKLNIEPIEPEEPMLSSEPPLFTWPGFFAMRALCNAGRSRRNVGGA